MTACAVTSPDTMATCVGYALKAKVVRIDERNHRFFLASKTLKARDIKLNISKVEQCLAYSYWKTDFALSLFTEAKFAGYRDEANIIPWHKGNHWAKAYVAEYNHRSKSLLRNPAMGPEEVK